MDVKSRFKRAVRIVLNLPPTDDGTLRIDRLALYRAEVKVASNDGKTVDVAPEDKRVEPHQGVPLRTGIPGATAVVQPGAIVLLGWEAGDPSRPYAVPSWENGATVTKLVLKAQTVYLGDEAGAEPLVRKSDFDNHTHAAGTLQAAPNGAVTGATAGATSVNGTQNVRGK
jgi:hypothetical protein